MKIIISILSLLFAGASIYAQGPVIPASDVELINKAKNKLNDFLPVAKGGNEFVYATYLMSVDTFFKRIAAYKEAANKVFDQSSSADFRKIAAKRIGYYCIIMADKYKINYGSDSLKKQVFYKLLAERKTGGNDALSGETLMKANADVYIKKMSPEENERMDAFCYKDWNKNDSALFTVSSEYRQALSNLLINRMHKDFGKELRASNDQALIKLMVAQKYISNNYILDYYRYSCTADIIKSPKSTNSVKDSVYKSYMSFSSDPAHRLALKRAYDNYINIADNKMAPDFSYATVKGDKVSLKSLQGKYVYIDVWATWCGPCKAEIPHLAKLEEELAGKNIHFVSLSVDVPADRNKWKQYVEENSLKGIQLISDNAFDSDFVKKFNINSIPRFILIDPTGKIVSANALRPSNPELRKQLESFN